ncbi:MAG: 2-amino-4-hydroxy-6-hydroxymethyldihydropteridine diphosphokinase [Methylicorpusculum sp.]|uniref:2-amino-4-hydroxy-6- hydroxymethyldihydropteridine diphosphokinase n=1 Tax=Methylicorpusculum sp. TaxID=2713644 RepID=UPI002716FA2A|nr:2-amino-4-hydroxy-6-hydroxymethyldihydropteridine diphosphokinase [Methylicorpusculum sp.]MDO8843769.1 2-amino-4-hydroxy-6-hydroxymethyldihydropteridine diphosphokinase [Methylicorpusculum sp.]MDO8939621.1 2-amino-4-hydroxy-6-hydroxymethyldihydropteridine diphosphokinase [Methylicorpusculum sp.]MDO9238711.1 2-amino-4-hydroxy-6-hydroxymethyldihydropteridine diphosphokinase [Methylicorpusculum sp.]MDP2180624.1 2-amino-4-hydroxy-6-hydroxymethyldihydropteridine diphosphokinase [Methylicorpusculu
MTVATVIAYIGLGSNLDDPVQQIKSARAAIAAIDKISEVAFSSLYRSLPMGPQDQPDYVNAVMSVSTDLEPFELLRCLQAIEHEQGRVRTGLRWGARTLDLDLLIYDQMQLADPVLTLPHSGLADRAFVLYPLHEIAPDLLVPGYGPLTTLLEHCPQVGLQQLYS